jgi:hypothetical protein
MLSFLSSSKEFQHYLLKPQVLPTTVEQGRKHLLLLQIQKKVIAHPKFSFRKNLMQHLEFRDYGYLEKTTFNL